MSRGGDSSVLLWVGGSVSAAQKKGILKPGGPRLHRETTPFPCSLTAVPTSAGVETPRKECHNCPSAACSGVGRQAQLSLASAR